MAANDLKPLLPYMDKQLLFNVFKWSKGTTKVLILLQQKLQTSEVLCDLPPML